eukprot:7611053-Pyramimonas_sp.AAC.2
MGIDPQLLQMQELITRRLTEGVSDLVREEVPEKYRGADWGAPDDSGSAPAMRCASHVRIPTNLNRTPTTIPVPAPPPSRTLNPRSLLLLNHPIPRCGPIVRTVLQ